MRDAERHGLADALRRAGDDDDLAGEAPGVFRHRRPRATGPGSDVVDVDDVVDVVVLENYFLSRDQRLRARGIECVKGCAEIGVHGLVAVAEGHPVEAQSADAVSV
jgi:hypothetical protein